MFNKLIKKINIQLINNITILIINDMLNIGIHCYLISCISMFLFGYAISHINVSPDSCVVIARHRPLSLQRGSAPFRYIEAPFIYSEETLCVVQRRSPICRYSEAASHFVISRRRLFIAMQHYGSIQRGSVLARFIARQGAVVHSRRVHYSLLIIDLHHHHHREVLRHTKMLRNTSL